MKNLLTTRLPRIRAAVFALTLLHLPAAWAQGDGDQNSGSAIDIAEAGAAGLDQDKTLPIEIHPGSPMADLVSLANSGVGQEVIMGFVTGSTRMFNLSAEQIIYLKDIGLGDPVITAIMVRDQSLRADSSSPVAYSPPVPSAADAPPESDVYVIPYPTESSPGEAGPDFYNGLSPYGTWVNLEGYGPVWQPTAAVINPAWQPYYDRGRWIYADYGWYWGSGLGSFLGIMAIHR